MFDVICTAGIRHDCHDNAHAHAYGSQAPPSPPTTVRRAFVLRVPTRSKTVWPGEFLEVQLPDDAPVGLEYALEPRTDAPSLYVISSPLSCGRNPVSFPVLCGQSTYQTCQPNLERLSVTNTSARSPLSSNQKRSYRQASLLLSIRYLPLMLATLHPSR